MPDDRILGDVESYYSEKLREHGATPSGVDWNSRESQVLRFRQLLEVARDDEGFSLNDYGCGYGALAEWLADRGGAFTYTGFDISRPMLEEARDRVSDPRISFVHDEESLETADYTVASGIFNVKLETEDQRWRDYVGETIERLWELSGKGMAFNMLTGYSDAEYMRDDLHYPDPGEIIDLCARRYSRHVALLHDYGLYEFTVIVRRDEAVPYPGPGRT